jgi:hypothetical protein
MSKPQFVDVICIRGWLNLKSLLATGSVAFA